MPRPASQDRSGVAFDYRTVNDAAPCIDESTTLYGSRRFVIKCRRVRKTKEQIVGASYDQFALWITDATRRELKWLSKQPMNDERKAECLAHEISLRKHPLLKSFTKLRNDADPWLRRIMFPYRDTRFAYERDSALHRIVNTHNPSASPDHADAELELDTRDWLRDFWSRSFVAWIALVISIISVVFAMCAFFR
jgi:hypothetical protein